MNIIFAGSKGKTGSIIFNYLKEKGFIFSNEINLNETKLKDIIKPNSIVIDFTHKDIAYEHATICLENNSHFICGTTGISDKQINEILEIANKKNLNFIFNPNFSLGIPIITQFIPALKSNFKDIKIIESHHISKKDLPSGTALLLKKQIDENIQIESIRTTYPSLDHTIIFKNEYEEITIKHSANNKLAYALGVEKSLKELLNKLKCD